MNIKKKKQTAKSAFAMFTLTLKGNLPSSIVILTLETKNPKPKAKYMHLGILHISILYKQTYLFLACGDVDGDVLEFQQQPKSRKPQAASRVLVVHFALRFYLDLENTHTALQPASLGYWIEQEPLESESESPLVLVVDMLVAVALWLGLSRSLPAWVIG